ncbi:4-hydroxy-tetrahydrodipicolinate synthase [Reichenbachiella versicolor]|uniref:4-hydroxy-tetrahydrodipicolinate synthase n=1 Tax=Reichenbachiella versicolor TaxID=1821036 RepID=UPI000D6EA27D|nr:4-hydroxy-tetrahydrodipicolinate synthase [Reichenbachiella versicolor]
MVEKLKGTGVAMVTPFNDDKSIDFDSLAKLVDHVSQGGVDYLVVMGTTAESPTLSVEEKLAVLRFVKEKNTKGLPIVYGMGGNNTMSLVEQYQNFDEEVDAFLVVTPYYNRPSQQGLIEHYTAVADAAKKPIILYNVPKRTGTNMEAKTVLELAKHPNIIGVKEASGGNLQQTLEIAHAMPEDFLLTSGDDDLIVPFIAAGGHGVISVIANALPKKTAEMVNLSLKGDKSGADKINDTVVPFLDLIFKEGSPAGIKSLLKNFGIGGGQLRLPLVPVTEGLDQELKSKYQTL